MEEALVPVNIYLSRVPHFLPIVRRLVQEHVSEIQCLNVALVVLNRVGEILECVGRELGVTHIERNRSRLLRNDKFHHCVRLSTFATQAGVNKVLLLFEALH